MKKDIQGKIWDTETLVMFGLWLVKNQEEGYGLLLIHGSVLGMKIGDLLKLKWNDFINGITDECEIDLFFESDRKKGKETDYRILNFFIERITQEVYQTTEGINLNDFVYKKRKTGQVLSTSTLNRELNKLYNEFKQDVYNRTFLELKMREIKTNAIEIAWARDLVKKYELSPKAFIAASKYMGHRTVKDTIALLELEPTSEILISHDLFNPDVEQEEKLKDTLENNEYLRRYLFNKSIANVTPEYEKNRDKSKDYHASEKELEWIKENQMDTSLKKS